MGRDILDTVLDGLDGDGEVEQLVIGAFFTAVVSRTVGLASTLRRIPPRLDGGLPVNDAGRLLPASARSLAALARSESLLEASVGLAALNSLIEVDPEACAVGNAGKLLARHGCGRRVVVVGNFPFVPKLREVVGQLWTFEQGDKVHGDVLGEEQMDAILPRAEVAAISSTTLLNGSLDHILERLDRSCFKVLVGPSTPMFLSLLELGFDALCGSIVEDRAGVLACVAQGATFRQIDGVRHVTLAREGGDRPAL
jgi:hypothetical protein